MVKLLRLTTEKQDASFDIQFNEDIIIKPKSQMALKNVTFTMDEDILTIDNTNSKFLFTTDFNPGINNDREFSLTYNKFNLYHSNDTNEELRNFDKFIEFLNLNANSKLKCTNANNDFNTEVIFSVNENNLFQMECFKSILFDFVPTLADITSDMSVDKTGSIRIDVSHDGTSTTTQKNKLVFNDDFIRGAGVFRCKIADFTANGSGNRDNGFEIGLSDVSPTTFINNTDMKNSERTFMIRFNRVGEVYTYLETRADGDETVETDSTVTVTRGAVATLTTNDIIELKLEQGDIVGNVYMHDGANYVKHQIFRNTLYGDLSPDAKRVNKLSAFYTLHPYIVMYGNTDDVAVCDIQHSLKESAMINYQQRINPDTTLPKITYLIYLFRLTAPILLLILYLGFAALPNPYFSWRTVDNFSLSVSFNSLRPFNILFLFFLTRFLILSLLGLSISLVSNSNSLSTLPLFKSSIAAFMLGSYLALVVSISSSISIVSTTLSSKPGT